jgi:hypothetical protein
LHNALTWRKVSALHKLFQPTTLKELTMADLTPREQLVATEKQLTELSAKVDALKKQTREEDLKAAKELIKTHGFGVSDLRPELKTTRTASTTKKAPAKGRGKRN